MTDQPQETSRPAAPLVDPDRSAILAEMAAATKPAPEPESKEPPPESAEPAEAATETTEEETDAPAPEPAKAEAKPDPNLESDKRLAAIQKAEKAAKQAAAAERAAIAKERAEIEAARKEAAEAAREMAAFKQALARAKYDPAGVLAALGVPEDRFEDAATALYARSKKGAEDPRYKEQSERAMREREHADKLSATEQRLLELERKIEERAARADAERAAERHMAGVYKAARASTEAPLLTQLFNKNAEKAERQLAQIALDLANETGELPDADDVIATFEKRRREELQDLGIDVAAVLKTTTTKPQSKTAGEKPSARTLSNDLSTSTQVRRSDLSEQEERDQILAEIAKLNRGSDADARHG